MILHKDNKPMPHLVPASLDERLKVVGGRLWVTPQHGTLWELLVDLLRHTDVCQQHELFHHRVGLSQLLGLYFYWIVSLAVHLEPDLWWRKH